MVDRSLDIPINEVHTTLLETTDGKLILQSYRKNIGFPKKNVRNLLARTLLRKEKDDAFQGVRIEEHPQRLDKFILGRRIHAVVLRGTKKGQNVKKRKWEHKGKRCEACNYYKGGQIRGSCSPNRSIVSRRK